jgi:hypothetical protein
MRRLFLPNPTERRPEWTNGNGDPARGSSGERPMTIEEWEQWCREIAQAARRVREIAARAASYACLASLSADDVPLSSGRKPKLIQHNANRFHADITKAIVDLGALRQKIKK